MKRIYFIKTNTYENLKQFFLDGSWLLKLVANSSNRLSTYFPAKKAIASTSCLTYSGSQLHEVHFEAQREVQGVFIAMNYEL